MAHKNGIAAVEAHAAYSGHIIFEEQDGFYWLRGKNLERAKRLLGFEHQQADFGVDSATLADYVDQLDAKGLKVAFLRGSTIQAVKVRKARKQKDVPSTVVGLAPELLLGRHELDRLHVQVEQRRSYLADFVGRLSDQHSGTLSNTFASLGSLYVYQVAEDCYEVDWELSRITRTTFEAFAVLADTSHSKLRCLLVEPRSRRLLKKAQAERPKVYLASEPVTFGQLRLSI